MNHQLTAKLTTLLLLAGLFMLPSCIKDKCSEQHTYTFYVPIYKEKSEVMASIKSNAPGEITNPGKIYIHGNYIFLNEVDKGIHVIDNSNPSNPLRIAFIDIPGNMDLAAKGNILYADMYADLVAMDISDPKNVKLVKTLERTFPERNWGNGFSIYSDNRIVVDWIQKDTTVVDNCDRTNNWFEGRGDVFFAASSTKSSASVSPVGTGGSMARFTIAKDYLYTVDHHTLRSFLISNAADPQEKNQIMAGFDIETIYPFKDALFIGTMGGMNIFDISNPALPTLKSNFVHARACDPVIADEEFAYVTLRAGTSCGPAVNELLVINIENLQAPQLVKRYPMTNPAGLAKDDDLLFICDGRDGLKTFNADNVQNLQLLNTIGNMETYDVIAMNDIALVVAKDGLYQFDYSNASDIRLLSKITVNRQ